MDARWDAAIVGAGPAGSFAAYLLARGGHRVLVIERAAFPRQKICGCCLNPSALAILEQANLGKVATEAGAVRIASFRVAARKCEATLPLTGWMAASRARLDAQLVAAAVRAGAIFTDQTTARIGDVFSDRRGLILRRGDDEIRVQADVVLAADGLNGRLLADATSRHSRLQDNSRLGAGTMTTDSEGRYEPGVIHMACAAGGYLGLVRLHDDELNVAAAFDAQYVRAYGGLGHAAQRLLAEVGWPALPNLADQLWRGTPALTRQPARPAAERVLAIGDAAGYIEPFTGEGIAWALAGAEAVLPFAAQPWRANTAKDWAQLVCRTGRQRQKLIRAIAWGVRRPHLTQVALRLLKHFPHLAGSVADWFFTPSQSMPLRSPFPAQIPERRMVTAQPAASIAPR